MKKVEIVYNSEIVSESTIVHPQCCTSISFENLGTADVTIMDNIPVTDGKIREFVNDPGEFIMSSFPVKFGSTGTCILLVVRTFAKIVE